MYEVPRPEDILCQGDIFRGDFVFPFFDPNEIHIEREQGIVPSRQVDDAWHNGTEAVLLSANRTEFAIILSNTCDLAGQKKPLEFVTLGAILPLDKFSTEKDRGNCASNRLKGFHHLRPHEDADLVDSFVHFGMLTQISFETLNEYKDHRVLSLLSPYKESLGHRFGEFISRVAIDGP
jgi:hypothetical protein